MVPRGRDRGSHASQESSGWPSDEWTGAARRGRGHDRVSLGRRVLTVRLGRRRPWVARAIRLLAAPGCGGGRGPRGDVSPAPCAPRRDPGLLEVASGVTVCRAHCASARPGRRWSRSRKCCFRRWSPSYGSTRCRYSCGASAAVASCFASTPRETTTRPPFRSTGVEGQAGGATWSWRHIPASS